MSAAKHGAFSSKQIARRSGKPADPRLVETIASLLEPGASVLDMGAGAGRYVMALRERGFDAHGVDGCPQVAAITGGLVSYADLADPDSIQGPYDAAISIEVGEHVPEHAQEAFVGNLVKPAPLLIVSWAPPGQRGRGHVCCREPAEVQALLTARGMALDGSATRMARVAAGGRWAEKLLVMRRVENRAENAVGADTVRVRLLDGSEVEATPVRAIADQLMVAVNVAGAKRFQVLPIGAAVDPAAFAAAWKRLGGEHLTLEDGTPFRPFS